MTSDDEPAPGRVSPIDAPGAPVRSAGALPRGLPETRLTGPAPGAGSTPGTPAGTATPGTGRRSRRLPRGGTPARSWHDLARWAALGAVGFGLAAWAVHSGGRLGTAAAPFEGRYSWHLGPTSLLAPALAGLVLVAVATGLPGRIRWPALLAGSWIAAFGWAVCLAAARGTAGLTRPINGSTGYRAAVASIGDTPLDYLRRIGEHPGAQAPVTREHPPGPVLLMWLLHRAGLSGDLALALLLAAAGAAAVPLVLVAVRGVCGEPAARGYLPVLVLAPSAVWGAASVDGMAALLGAAMAAAGVRATAAGRTGWRATGWAVLAGLLLGLAAQFSYAAPWLGLSLVCLYFARRRPLANLVTGLGALLPVLAVDRMGFSWLSGLRAAHPEYAAPSAPAGTILWWSLLSLVVVVLATGPPGMASLRKIRNTPGWPFLVGATAAVLFSVLTGLARGGGEHAWLAFFPWLTVAAVAPEQPAGPPVPPPLLLAGAGAAGAVVLQAVLLSPW